MTSDISLTAVAMQHLLRELIHGPSGFGNWLLDADSRGYAALTSLNGSEASARPTSPSDEGRSSIAAHVRHTTYGLQLLNRWAAGEENPFATADWKSTWEERELSDAEWSELLQRLTKEATTWIEAVAAPRTWDEISLTGAIASVAHLAYHLGAIQQRM